MTLAACLEFLEDLVWFSPDIDAVMRASEIMLNHIIVISYVYPTLYWGDRKSLFVMVLLDV